MIDISRFDLRPLTADMPLLPFCCADKDLNEFLAQDAKNYLEEMMAVTYVSIDPDKQQIAAEQQHYVHHYVSCADNGRKIKGNISHLRRRHEP